jgi:hypothetical protein
MTGPPRTNPGTAGAATGAQVTCLAAQSPKPLPPDRPPAQIPPDFKVRDGCRTVGAVISCAGGYAAHSRGGKLGVFDTTSLALAAVRAADRDARRKSKAEPLE